MIARPAVVAHRGGVWPDLAGEQSAAHVERSIACGADFIEVDLHRTADGQLICVHDPHVGRLAVAAASLAALQDAASQAGLPPILTLGGLLDQAAGRIGLDLEVKTPGFEAQLVDEVRRGFSGRVFYKSFHDRTVRAIRRHQRDAWVGLLLGTGSPRFGPITRITELFPEGRLRACGARFVSPHWRLLRVGFVRRMGALGLPVLPWTVNDPAVMSRWMHRVAGLVTDDPVTARRLRDGISQ